MRGAVLTAVLCLLAVVAGCTGGAAEPEPSGTASGDIVLASGLDVTGTGGVRQQLIDAWNRTPEGTRHPARLVELPGPADQQRSQLLGALQSGSAQYDVVNLDVTWVPEFAQAGLISPLDQQADLSQDFIGTVAGTASWRHHTYAVPFNSDVGLLYYRPDYLKAAGVEPSNYPHAGGTWQQIHDAIEILNRRKPAGYQSGWTSQLASYEGLTVNVVEAFASAGVQLADDNGHYTADAAGLRAGLVELWNRTRSEFTLPDAFRSLEDQSLADFTAGQTAFLRHWPYAYRVLPQSLSPDSVAVAPLPGRAVLGGQDLAIAAGSPRSRYAMDLIRFLTSAPSERCLLDRGFAATRTSAYNDPHVRCTLPAAPEGPAGSGEKRDMPRSSDGRPRYATTVLLPALQAAVSRPRTPYYGAFTQAVQSVLYPWLATSDAGAPTDQLVDQLNKAISAALQGG